ncbi:hypothetical protein FoTM2_002975 [Fusarium oxysporum f. sp. vasinfectum]|nr:hypothetical protein FoTM2_002975 [Fusarium oxysporum f. sp. vasinfectum]
MAYIEPTEVAVAPAFDVAGPAVTATATLHQRDLFGRQNNYDSCGYYSFPNSDWATWQCGEEGAWTTTCKTIGSHFGCFQNIFTTCYPSASICDSTDQRALCCTADINGNTNYPYCATGIKPLGDGEEISIYLCGKTEQQVPFYESTVIPVTTGSTTGEQTLTSIDTTRGVIVTETAEPSPRAGNPAPVGAIIGGVVGGVALIAILGLAFWFLRSKKPQNKEQMGYQQDMPPPPNVRGRHKFPHQSPPVEPYKTAVSPVSELPIASSPHDNTPVSELPADMRNGAWSE